MSVPNIRSSFRRKQQVFTNDVQIILMNNTCVQEKFEKNAAFNGVSILRRLGERLSISETELMYFGLKFPTADGQMNWLCLSEHVDKQLGKRPYNFQLGVRVYPEANDQLSLNCLRLCCYQIKCDLIRGYLLCSANEHASIDSYFAQAVIGDYNKAIHSAGYLEDYLGSLYIPPSSGVNCSTVELRPQQYENEVVRRHQGHSKMTTKEAWLALLNIASTIPQFNALTHRAKDSSDKTTVQISVFQDGVKIYKLNVLGEVDAVKREYDWAVLNSIITYKKKLVLSTSSGVSKYKFSGTYGDMAAKRLREDILECRLYHNCYMNGTNLLVYHTEENRRHANHGNHFARRRSSSFSFRNGPVMKRQGSFRRAYSSLRYRLSKNRERQRDDCDGTATRNTRRPLSTIQMIPK